MDNKITCKTIVFIHGLFQNPASWHEWKEFFEARGYQCHTPAYPFHEGNPASLRSNIDPALGKLTFGRVIEGLASFIDGLSEKPILIGHSMGGLAAQKLLDMGKGCAAIAIDTAPPKGIFIFKWSFLKANLPTINPFKGDSVCMPSVEWFYYAFCNTMTREETKVEYDKFFVPESRNIPRSTMGVDGKIDFSKPHSPLLFIAGAEDNIIPSALNRKNCRAYTDKNSKTDFKEFSGRTHYICGQKNWQEVSEYIDGWISTLRAKLD